jgi:hypothetical protein
MKYLLWLGCTALSLSTHLALASKVDFSGFATAAASYVDSEDVQLRTNFLNNKHDSLTIKSGSNIGLQANVTLADKWDAVGQIVLQDRIESSPNDFLELAFMRYRPNRHWAIRAGRINNDLYLLSEYPYVGYAYLWTRPPNDHYAIATSATNFDGLDIEYKTNLGKGFIKIRTSYGETSSEIGIDNNRFAFSVKDIVTLSASYQIDSWLLRATHSQSNYQDLKSPEFTSSVLIFNEIPDTVWPAKQQILDDFDITGKYSLYSSAGLSYEGNRWLFYTEIGHSKSDWVTFTPSITGYATLGYIQDDITYFMSISGIKNTKKLASYSGPILDASLPLEFIAYLSAIDEAIKDRLSTTPARQATISIGTKYDLTANINLKLQVDHTNISPIGYGLWQLTNATQSTVRRKINTFSLSFNVLF